MGVPGDGSDLMKLATKATAEQMILDARRYASRRSMLFLLS
jgi:hypothetical protein